MPSLSWFRHRLLIRALATLAVLALPLVAVTVTPSGSARADVAPTTATAATTTATADTDAACTVQDYVQEPDTVPPAGDPDDYSNATYGQYYIGRSFTAQGSTITQLGAWMYQASDQPLTFTIISGTSIDGPVVGTVTAPGAVGEDVGTFATPLAVTQGDTYILKINSPSATAGIAFAGAVNGDTIYSNGGGGDATGTTIGPATAISFGGAADGNGCPDPSQTASYSQGPGTSYWSATYGNFYAGRSFTAIGTGITAVGTWMYQASDQPLTFTLISGTDINGPVIASTNSATSGGTGLVTAAFPNPVAVTPGDTYILKVNSPTATQGIDYVGTENGDTGYSNSSGSAGVYPDYAPATLVDFTGAEQTTVSYPPIDADFNAVFGSSLAGESFTAADGSLESATIYLTQGNDGPLTISVRNASMSGRVLGAATLAAGGTGAQTVTFSPAIPLTTGNTYVLAVAPASVSNQAGVVAQQAPNDQLQGYTQAGAVDTDMAMTLVFGPPIPAQPITTAACPAGPQLTQSYVQNVEAALDANTDTWGNEAIEAPDGPSLANVSGHLNPLFDVGSPAGMGGTELTNSGVYYLPFGAPGQTFDDGEALHVADGSQIISTDADGPSMTIFVGDSGTERYGLCQANLTGPTLLDGYQPVLDTGYTDLDGTAWTQQSFAAYLPGTQQLASWVKLTATGSQDTEVSLEMSDSGLSASDGVVSSPSGTELYYSGDATLSGSTLSYDLPLTAGQPQTIYLVRPVTPGTQVTFTPDEASYQAALATVTTAWNTTLAGGATFDVPETAVMNAQKNLLIQNLALEWRYSVGNDYEAWYPSESGDSLQMLADYGYTAEAKEGLQYILDQPLLASSPNWDRGARMGLSAQYYDVTKDAAFIDQNTPLFESFLNTMQQEIAADPHGLLPPSAEGNDIPTPQYYTHTEAIAWNGMTAILRVWRETGHSDLADEYQPMVNTFTKTLKAAIKSSSVQVSSDQLFIPWALFSGEQPFASITESKDSSYWNLEIPYVYASGILSATQLKEALNYGANHGATLLGLERFNYYPTAVGSVTAGGLPGYDTDGDDDVYAVSRVEAQADADEPDQLALTLYGKLAAGMTQNTFISGEGETIDPSDGNYDRSMYLPPDLANNDLFLTTLHEMLVHFVYTGVNLVPTGLQLAYSTPLGWLDNGKTIKVANAPTPFGDVSYTITSHLNDAQVKVTADLPKSRSLRDTSLRLRLPGNYTVGSAVLSDGRTLKVTDGQDIDLTGLHGQISLTVKLKAPLRAAPAVTTAGHDARLSAVYTPGGTGTVTFTTDGTTLCTAALGSDKVATCDAGASLAAGTYQVDASYSGDARHDPAHATFRLAVLTGSGEAAA